MFFPCALCLAISLPVRVFFLYDSTVCVFACVCTCVYVCRYLCISKFPSRLRLSVSDHVQALHICLSVCLYVCLSVCLSVCLHYGMIVLYKANYPSDSTYSPLQSLSSTYSAISEIIKYPEAESYSQNKVFLPMAQLTVTVTVTVTVTEYLF